MKGRMLGMAAGAAALLVAGCGGGSDSGGASQGPDYSEEEGTEQTIVAPPPPAYASMDEAAASAYAKGAEFNRIEPTDAELSKRGWYSACGSDPDCVNASNYTLQNIHYAHTASLPDGTKVRGKGTLIAVVDDGFLTSHQELAGKTIHTYLGAAGSLAVMDHGTAVASITAGLANGKGMMGVAPEADLHLSSWGNIGNVDLLSHITGATNDAAALGAVVQNNSWGWVQETAAGKEQANFAASGKASYADYIASTRGGTALQWQRLFDAYDDFQQSGVIVYSNSNDSSLGDASAWAALPLYVPELSEAWLTVSNARFTLDANDGTIRDAQLLSAPCGEAARFCLTSDGVVYAPTAGGNTAYGVMTGTSFAAPQVSGQVALLAQAFPDLSPAEWTTRLLATAQTDWKGFEDSIAGYQTFAPNVTHPYSHLYGHGVPDMKAALSPVGGLSVASGENVFTAERTSLDSGIATAGPVIGNSVAKAMAGKSVMVIDALGTDFYVPGSALAESGNSGMVSESANAGHIARNVEQVSASFAFVETDSPAVQSLQDAAVPKLFFSQTLASGAGETSFSQILPLGDRNFLQFAGHMEQTVDGSDAAFSLSRLMARDGYAAEISFSFGHSSNRFFGGETRGPFVDARNTGNASAGLSLSKPLSASWSLAAYAELGSGLIDDGSSALVDYGAFAYASGGLSARRRGVLTKRDTVDFYAGIRPAAIAGDAELSLPVGREQDGTIRYERIAVDLVDADLPMRLGFVYRNRTENDFDLLLGFNSDLTASEDPNPVYSVSVGLKKEF